MSDILMPKGPGMQGPKDAVMERLRRRITGYRKHHDDFGPRFEHTVNGLNDQQKQETLTLRQKFLESKPKKSAKKSDKNKQDGSGSTGNQKLQKRPCEDNDLGSGVNGGSESYEPPTKITVCGGINGNVSTSPATGAFKHHQGQSPSQVHPGELIGANSHPNSKPLASSGLKPGSGSSAAKMTSPISDPRVIGVNGPSSNSSYSSTNNITMEFKQEPNSAFVDLDECAAALEKDAAENGSIMSGLIGMGDFDTLKDLISEISDNPDFMKDFDDFDDDHQSEKGMQGRSISMNPTPNHLSTNPASCADSSNASFSGHSHSRTPPVAPVTPTTSSPRLSHVKMESELNSTGHDGGCGNRGLSHCAGPSPAAASTASPLASQLSSHHPSQTPPYSSGSAMFDSASPSGAQSQANPLTPNSNANYCPSSNTPTPHNPGVQGMTSKGTRIPYTSPGSLTLDSPAAQTLKQMAEQHKHKAQLGMNTFIPNPGSNPSPARSPYSSGEYNGGYSASGEFSGGSNMNVNSNNSSSSYSNVAVRNQSNSLPSVSSVSDNMTMTMPTIKQETSSLYSPTNFPPSMDISKRSNVTNHVHHPPPPSASQSQPHKISASNSTRLPNSAMIPQSQQQPPLYSSKSFSNSSGSQLGPSVNASVSTSHMANSSHLQQFMNRPPNSGLSAVPPNNYPPTSHSGYQGSANHSTVQMNQNQPISQPNPAAPMPVRKFSYCATLINTFLTSPSASMLHF
ncbi:unnamed protein product [Allacma fusca]|uniref:Neurogenic mastermind-like N-terminal domain-containing protein n=1 Tax=Allacma fusca TaxID=39272 RepID=A0A8J2Q0G9_9HEXA|nr:unnamed protein product [Allacma fusca]